MFLRGIRLLPPRAGMMARFILRGSGEVFDDADDTVEVRVPEIGVEREAERFGVICFRFRTFPRLVSVGILVEGLKVNRDVEDLCSNAGIAELLHHFAAGFFKGGEF